jgi:hypothetical protein
VKKLPVEQSFYLSFVRSESGCWEWVKTRSQGYGVLRVNGKPMLAHRYAWTIFRGPIPDRSDLAHGSVVMHMCDNRACVNPDHLRVGTQADNVRDMDEKGRRRTGSMPGSTHHQSKLTESDVIAIRLSNEPHGVLAEKYGVTPEAIQYARRNGWRHVQTETVKPISGKSLATRGSNNSASKLTDDDVRKIRASTRKPGVVAKEFKIQPDYVTMIRKRKAWKHVP